MEEEKVVQEQVQATQAKKKRRKRKKEKSLLREIIGWIVYLAFLIIATQFIITYLGQRTKVIGDSMEPILHNADHLIVDKVTYRFKNPERYDIIVFPYRYKEGTFYIKRIIGLPGERIQILEGQVYINGKKLDESYGNEEMKYAGIAETTITLGYDEYFVLGDNRNHSSDSRFEDVGVVKKEEFTGRAILRIWPLNSFEIIKHE